ncbi:MAG: DUF4861 domain-containing protein [Flavobacteriaceae bacterium]|nr:DUF4861 domain-containing protein [Flavobacteriaceae bacterium]
MKLSNVFAAILLSTTLLSFSQKNKIITISNSLNTDREFETVELSKTSLGLKSSDKLEKYRVKELGTSTFLISQCVDENGDEINDVLLFQPKIKALATNKYEIVFNTDTKTKDPIIFCYSRFVPERTDDYAWENNKVAFRTYGPVAQKMAEDKVKGGTLTSGIDAWLKRVEYPVINKWYEKYTTGTGTYHKDTGEGLDNFHVGDSRGIGGIAVKIDSTYYYSKNFISWKTITTGPLRTSFTLTYADWDAKGNKIKEVKHISLDYGSFLSKFEIQVSGINTLSTGITLHNNDGKTESNFNAGWIDYWQPIDDSELGTGIVFPKNTMISAEKYMNPNKELCNLYAALKVVNNKVTYYTGFGWKKQGEFTTKEAWEKYLEQYATKINSPLIVKIK